MLLPLRWPELVAASIGEHWLLFITTNEFWPNVPGY
jgi:hypothetical protein